MLVNSQEERIVLPIHYNYLLQTFIYNNIDKKLADFKEGDNF
ncbi:MAG: hypothetical protein ABIK78_03945 [candidate division WOR-3 bacterium]